MKRPLIAYFSPLKPDRSGVADYSEQLLPRLVKYFDIHLYGNDQPPETRLIQSMFKWFPRRDFELQNRKTPYDLNVYQIGNNTIHQFMYPVMARYPGVVVLHDANLHHARANSHLGHRNLNDYLDELTWCHGESGAAVGRSLAHGFHSDSLFDLFPMLNIACSGARSVVVHNQFAADRVAKTVEKKHIFKIPLPYFEKSLPMREAARKRLEINEDETVIAAFGFITPGKGLESLLTAFQVFHRQYPNSRCVFAGGFLDQQYQRQLGSQVEATPGAMITGYTPEKIHADWLASADICVSLRFPTQGESSAALLHVMGAKKPVIISDYRQFREYPDHVCIHIPVYPNEPYALLTALRMLMEEPDKAQELAENARQYTISHNSGDRWIESFSNAIKLSLELPVPEALSRRCPLRHVRVAPVEESIALCLQNLGESILSEHVLNPIDDAVRELGLDG